MENSHVMPAGYAPKPYGEKANAQPYEMNPAYSAGGKGKPEMYAPMMKSGSMKHESKAPGDTLHCPPRQAPAVYDPEQTNVQHVYKPVIVRHYHPMRTQIRTHYVYEHQHYYPHRITKSSDERHYDVQCGRPCYPKPHC